MSLLIGEGLGKRFGGVHALTDVCISVAEGEIVGLIGPNGAGKTTLFNIVAGAFPPTSGTIRFDGGDITGLSSVETCRRGIARTFQVTRPFGDMTCRENVAVAIVSRRPRSRRSEWTVQAHDCLAQVGLESLADAPAKQLNVVQRKKLEIARALATEPRLLMLDEVLGGLNTQEIGEAVEFIRQLRDRRGLTIFWIEHVMGAIMRAADRVVVLDQGRLLMEGKPADVVADPRVVHAYLGE